MNIGHVQIFFGGLIHDSKPRTNIPWGKYLIVVSQVKIYFGEIVYI